MAVICDTSKIRVYIDKSMGTWNVLVKHLRNKNGKDVKFSISHDLSLTSDEIYTMFFEKLEKGEFKQKRTTGGGILRQKEDGTYYLEYPASVAVAMKSKISDAPKPEIAPPKTIVGSIAEVLFDTHSPQAQALVGKAVIGSNTYSFSEGTMCKGILKSANGSFHVVTPTKEFVVPFIKELRPEPLNLNDKEVRRNLLGTIIVSKDGTHEVLLNNAVKDHGIWKLNGLSANQLMNGYTFEDGNALMASF